MTIEFSNIDLLNRLDPEANYFEQQSINYSPIQPSNYISITDFNSLDTNSTNTLSLLTYNIRSFRRNHDHLTPLLNNYASYPDILSITESWFSENYTSELNGYVGFHTTRKGRAGGGTSIYVKSDISATDIKEFCFCTSIIESCAVKLSFQNYELIILSIYRPPSHDINGFSNKLGEILTELRCKKVIILGDLNINLLLDNNPHIDNFISMLNSFHFMPHVTKPTHFPTAEGINPSLLDHIWTNLFSNCTTHIITGDFTNHLPVYFRITIPSNLRNKKELVKISFRLVNDETISRFNNLINNFNWNNIKDDDVNKYIDTFLHTVNSLYCKCFPLKIKYISRQHYECPWMTPELIKLTRLKSLYFNLWRAKIISTQENNFFKNRLTSILRSNKIKYYKALFEKLRHDMRKTWSLINNLATDKNTGCKHTIKTIL